MDAEEWRTAAERVLTMLDLPWEYGDWCVAAELLGLVDERTEVLNGDARFEGTQMALYAFVAQRFSTHRRRALPWIFHEAVARLPPAYQDGLLDLAESEQWTLQELRRAARETIREL